MSLDDKPWTETSSPMTRREIEDARAHLKAWFPNQSVERHTFNKLCDQAVRAVSAPPEVAQLSKLRRYDMEDVGLRDQSHFIMEETDNGDWVRFEDVEMLFTPSPLARSQEKT